MDHSRSLTYGRSGAITVLPVPEGHADAEGAATRVAAIVQAAGISHLAADDDHAGAVRGLAAILLWLRVPSAEQLVGDGTGATPGAVSRRWCSSRLAASAGPAASC